MRLLKVHRHRPPKGSGDWKWKTMEERLDTAKRETIQKPDCIRF